MGFGSSIMLMPVLVIVFGPLHAVPIMAIAAILANLSRVLIWWREVRLYWGQVLHSDISARCAFTALVEKCRNVRPDPYLISASCSPMRGGARRIGGRWPSKDKGSETTS